jgi:Xaa-Pro aminopeptidase
MKTPAITVVDRLQCSAAEAFVEVTEDLRSGVSEWHIANGIREILAGRGIRGYWYDIGVMALIGAERFKQMAAPEYDTKTPSREVLVRPGQTIFVDIHPQDAKTGRWGNWATTALFQPRASDDEQMQLLEQMREIQQRGIATITAESTGADVASFFLGEFETHGISLLDVRSNVGHTMHSGSKSEARRAFLDTGNKSPLGSCVVGIEPGGFRPKNSGPGDIVARFEDCVFVPHAGSAILLGPSSPVPLAIG